MHWKLKKTKRDNKDKYFLELSKTRKLSLMFKESGLISDSNYHALCLKQDEISRYRNE